MPKPRSRSAGSGTIWKNANGTYTAQIRTPDGRPSQSFTSERKATSWLAKMRRDMDTGDYVTPSEMSLGVWWDKWEKVYKAGLSASSRSSYTQSKKRIKVCHSEALTASLAALTRADVQAAVNALSKRYSDSTVRQTYIHMHDCLEHAVEDRLIRENPCKKIQLPKTRALDTGSHAMTDDDYDAFVAHCKTGARLTAKGVIDKRDAKRQIYKVAALTMLSSAPRRGEICSLMWSDLREGGISIERSLSDGGEITAPKNDQSIAVIPVPDDVMALIKALPRTGLYVFAGPHGKPMNPSTLYHWMVKHTEAVCSRRYTVHDLRHTMASRAAKAGVNPKVLQTITRHKRLETLLKVYTHIDEEQRRAAVNAVNPLGGKCLANADPKTAVSGK